MKTPQPYFPYFTSSRLRAGVLGVSLTAFAWLALVPAFSQQLTSGADFLQIPSGARGAAMGGAFTAVADDVNALTWNPAGLSMLEYPEFGYLYMLYLGDTGYNFGGFALPF